MALIEIKEDAFGISQPATALLNGLGYGISAISSFATSRWRNGIAIANYKDWREVLAADGVQVDSANLTLNQRSDVQVQLNRLREQDHREHIAFHAVEAHRAALHNGAKETGDALEDEWLENFWSLAARISSSDRQELWGRILSRESLAPGSVSVRTLKFLADLTPSEAVKLQAIAACSYFSEEACRGPECGFLYELYGKGFTGQVSSHSSVVLDREALPKRHDEIFVPAGFWLQPGGFAHTLYVPPTNQTRLKIGSKWFAIRMVHGTFHLDARLDDGVSLGVVMQITALGREVLELIQADPSPKYLLALRAALGRFGRAELIELSE